MATRFTVKTIADKGADSLRAAIAAAQDGDTIRFAPSLKNKTIVLTRGQLEILENITLDGSDAPGLAISGNKASRVFEIGAAATVVLKDLTIAQGKVTGSDEINGAGGGILTNNSSNLTVINCRFEQNTAGFGGGIYAGFQATTTVINSRFDGNDGTLANAERGGGAIATKSGGTLIVRGSTFTNNRGINGGAINSLLGELVVENSVFRGNDTRAGKRNAVTSGYGGAIYTDGANASGTNSGPGNVGGTITIRGSRFEENIGAGQGGGLFLFAYPPDKVLVENCLIANNTVIPNVSGDSLGGGLRHGNARLILRDTTFSENRAYQQGGGLWIGEDSPVSISNSTFALNRADNGKGEGLGGAIAIANRLTNATTISHTTIAQNKAGFMGGAFWLGDQSVTLAHSIVAFNTAGNPWKQNIQSPKPLTDGGNTIEFSGVEDDPYNGRVTTKSRIVDPDLGRFGFNGGFVPTFALLKGSPALDAAQSSDSTFDSRFLRRDRQPDIGSFEAVSGQKTFRGTSTNDLLVGSSDSDTLLGNAGNDLLVGDGGRDVLIGDTGADTFAYVAQNERPTLAQSRVRSPDLIKDFDPSKGDRVLLDVNRDGMGDRPLGLFNAGVIRASGLKAAMQEAFTDKNQQQRGAQALQAREAVVFTWQRYRYLGINNQSTEFSARQEGVIDLANASLVRGDDRAGVLRVADYFV